jgi:hypothetical protein
LGHTFESQFPLHHQKAKFDFLEHQEIVLFLSIQFQNAMAQFNSFQENPQTKR